MRFRHKSESYALAFLERCGHRLIRHNYRCLWCEIDLITLDEGSILHAVEVKNWSSSALLRHPLEVFSKSRIRKNHRALEYFIEEANRDAELKEKILELYGLETLYDLACSFDLIWLREGSHIEYYPRLF